MVLDRYAWRIRQNRRLTVRSRGTPAGTLLVHAELEARYRSYTSLYLYTHEKMAENIALYARVGYVEVERREEDGFRRVFMRKALQPEVDSTSASSAASR